MSYEERLISAVERLADEWRLANLIKLSDSERIGANYELQATARKKIMAILEDLR